MDARKVIASNRDLLVNSLSPPALDFLFHLVEHQRIEYTHITRHKDLQTTTDQIDDFINVVCKQKSNDLAEEFLQWLLVTGQNELHLKITEDLDVSTLTSGDTVDISNPSAFSADGIEDEEDSDCESLSRDTTSILEIKGVMPSQQFVDEKIQGGSTVYPLSSPIRGVAMLIVNSKFEGRPQYSRDGSENDINNLHHLFTWLGYQVLVHNNITSKDFISKIHTLTRDKKQRSYSSFVLCILSHGGIGTITMSDLTELYTDEIFDRLDSNNFPAMAAKPKFVFIDANNKNLAHDGGLAVPKTNSEHKIGMTSPLEPVQIVRSPTVRERPQSKRIELSTPVVDEGCTKVACKSDFVILLASFPGYTALHNVAIGSIATRVLVETFYKHAHKHHVAELAKKIRRKRCTKFLRNATQVITLVDTLSKDFYMFPLLL